MSHGCLWEHSGAIFRELVAVVWQPMGPSLEAQVERVRAKCATRREDVQVPDAKGHLFCPRTSLHNFELENAVHLEAHV